MSRPQILIPLLLLLCGCPEETGNEAKAKKPPDAIPVRIGVATIRSMSALYTTSATLRAEKRAIVPVRTGGVIERFLVEVGADVEAGAELVILEDAQRQIELARARANLAEKARALQRCERLHKRRAMSDNDIERSRREHDDAKKREALATLAVDRTTVRAPFAGQIVKRHLDQGAMVRHGTPVLEIADLDPLQAHVSVPERHVSRLAAGQTVRLDVDATATQALGRITRIAPIVDPATGTVRVVVEVARSAGLRAGAFIRVRVVTDRHTEALVVPRSAVIAQGRRRHVFRLNAAGDSVERVEVVTGFQEVEPSKARVGGDSGGRGLPETTQIPLVELREVRGTLKPGDRVVTAGAAALSDGARVRIKP